MDSGCNWILHGLVYLNWFGFVIEYGMVSFFNWMLYSLVKLNPFGFVIGYDIVGNWILHGLVELNWFGLEYYVLAVVSLYNSLHFWRRS